MESATIEGRIEKVLFHNEQTNYTVAKIAVDGRDYPITVTGTLPSIKPGEKLTLAGQWNKHPKYGDQFAITSYESVLPVTTEGIIKYLGSSLIKGIGPARAKKIVEKFGIKTLDVIENEANRLLEVEGIGERWLGIIRESFGEQKELKSFMPALQGLGISPAYAMKVYRRYGKESVSVVRENPYRLASDISGIGFRKADEIAATIGIPKNSPIRAEAGVLYILHEMSMEGHVYYPYSALIRKCTEELRIDGSIIVTAIDKLAGEKKLVLEEIKGYNQLNGDKAVYLAAFYYAEKGIAERLQDILSYPVNLELQSINDAVETVKKEMGLPLTKEQICAVKEAMNNKVMVLTGSPGTGKTTITKAIINLYERMGKVVLLAAPTGRAAKRMEQATGHAAATIHRLLEYNPVTGAFVKNEKNPLKADLLMIDESSMKGCILSYQLLKAVSPKTTVIYIGDADQLPSVEAGNVLRDIINSNVIPTVKLTEIHRQAGNSMIITNSDLIRDGRMPVTTRAGGKQDFYFFEIEDNEKVLCKIIDLVTDKIPHAFGFDPINDIQVLTPMHKGILGTVNLNAELQKHLNHSGTVLTRGEITLKLGDKVLQRKNNRLKETYNGDIGIVKAIDEENQEITVDFDGRLVVYDFKELDEIKHLGYAITNHKSQGSEYPVIVMPVVTSHYIMLQRNLIYTGVTRGKSIVVLVGTKKALGIAIRNNKTENRYTMLETRLRNTILANRP